MIETCFSLGRDTSPSATICHPSVRCPDPSSYWIWRFPAFDFSDRLTLFAAQIQVSPQSLIGNSVPVTMGGFSAVGVYGEGYCVSMGFSRDMGFSTPAAICSAMEKGNRRVSAGTISNAGQIMLIAIRMRPLLRVRDSAPVASELGSYPFSHTRIIEDQWIPCVKGCIDEVRRRESVRACIPLPRGMRA
jgi:hypothetical protein